MSKEIKCTIDYVAKTGGIKIKGDESWYNKAPNARVVFSAEDKGKTGTLYLDEEGKYKDFIETHAGSDAVSEVNMRSAMNQRKTTSLKIKVITANDPQIFESELNGFGDLNNVVATQTHIQGESFVAVVFYK